MAGLEELLTGRTLVKRYRIDKVIGRGGFAVVYRALDLRLDRPVAVKVITLTASDPGAREQLRARLQREARAAAGLPHHPNLVAVHDVGTDQELELDFLVMEMLRGENLAQYLSREGRPPPERALCILRDAAEGLAIGHRAGLIHRDVKPGNVFLANPVAGHAGFRVCVLDYGIALAIEDDHTVTRAGGANPLSPAYASPEQLRGERDLTPASDVFSLGVLGYQLFSGERPFATEPGQAPQGWTIRKPLRELNPEVPAAVEEVLVRAMNVDPDQRYADAGEFADALERASGPSDDVTRVMAAPAAAAPLAAAAAPPDDATVLQPPRPAAPPPVHRAAPPVAPPPSTAPAPRRKRGAWPLLLVLLLLAGAAAFAMTRGGGGGDRPAPVATDTAGGQPVTAAQDDPGATDPAIQPGADPGTGGGQAEPQAPAGGTPGSGPVYVPQPGPVGINPNAPRPNVPAATPGQLANPGQGEPARPAPSRPANPAPSTPADPAQPTNPVPANPVPTNPTPTNPPPTQPQTPPARPEPPLLGRPVPPAPRDTIRLRSTPPPTPSTATPGTPGA